MWKNVTLKNKVALLNGVSFVVLSVMLAALLIVRAERLFSYERFEDATDFEATTAQTENIRIFFAEASTAYVVQSAIIVVFFVVAGACALWFLSRKMVLAVSEFAASVEHIDADNLPKELRVPYNHPEIDRLENAFNKMLSQIDITMESQKRFVENAAHELKTPIASIMTNLEVLEMEESPDHEDYEEVFNMVKESAERMNALVKDLLTMTQLAQKQDEAFHFSEMTLIPHELQALIDEKNIDVDIRGDASIKGSKPLMERAFQNLIHNAVRYNKHDGAVRIYANSESVTISDTGPGIPKQKLGKIFEPFYCADPSRSRELGGSGLGLSIVKQILHLHDMEVLVDSEEGKGTTFTVHLKS